MPPDRDIDRELRDLGPHLEYPPTPDLARTVRDRLEAEAGGPGSSVRSGPQLWWIAAAAAVVLLVTVPVFASILNTAGTSFSGAGGAAGGVAESGGHGAGDAAEQDDTSSMATESGAPSSASPSSAEAACASPAPILETRPARGAPGDEFRILGKHFVAGFDTCDDTPPDLSAQTVPARDVRVEFRQDGKTWKLGSVAADEGSRIAARLEVPADARPGGAAVRTTYGQEPPEAPHGRMSAEAEFTVLEREATPADR